MMPKSVKYEICKRNGVVLPEMRKEHKQHLEIKQLQRSVDLLIPPTTFGKCVKHFVSSAAPLRSLRIERDAQSSLQHASEACLLSLFQEANLIAGHSKRVTVSDRDLRLALRLKSPL